MKKILFLFLLLPVYKMLTAQKSVADSFVMVLNSQKIDTVQTDMLLSMMGTGLVGDSLAYFSRKVIETGVKQKNRNVEAIGYVLLGYYFVTHGDKPQAMELVLRSLQLAEYDNNKKVLTRIYHFTTFFYTDRRCIDYAEKSLELAKQTGELIWECIASGDITDYYYSIENYDSALVSAQQEYALNLKITNKGKTRESLYITIPYRLGNIHLKLNNPDLALAYYKQSLEAGFQYNSLRRPYIGLVRFYKATKQPDSAFFYAIKLYALYEQNPVGWNTQPAQFLYEIYKEKGNADSALKYYEIFIAGKDARLSYDNAEKMENMRFTEELRQKDLMVTKLKANEERKQNLQYAAIALGLVAFVIIFLLLSHSIVANQKLIQFLGILSLLIVFEFINLLIHPYLANFTHHSPVLMLAIMVCIAALLIPLHHRLEKWITQRLVEKNKKIRLAAAKKTIAKLEGEQTN